MDLITRNKIIIALTQSILGAISPNFRAVLIDFSNGLNVNFFLLEDLIEDREEIEDVITDFDSLVMGIVPISIKYNIIIGELKADFSSDSIVPVYIRRIF